METASLIVYFCAESSVPLTAVQRRDEPTRDVYVTRDEGGDREFAGAYINSTACGFVLPMIGSLRVCTSSTVQCALPRTGSGSCGGVSSLLMSCPRCR